MPQIDLNEIDAKIQIMKKTAEELARALDLAGIPCFLNNENMAALFPGAMGGVSGFGLGRVLIMVPAGHLDQARAVIAEAIGEADVISLHVPLTPETKHLINAERLEQMKTGAIVINTARGGLVDHPALLAALESGRLFGAGLDVTDPELFETDTLWGYFERLRKVLLPKENEKHLAELPKELKSALELVVVDHMDQVLEHALLDDENGQQISG